ncbi:4-hydroxyphenylpyruvate dioxygenase [Kutzneria viridogrisea]|uniref:VOC domain-containing protein n=2 Tax=Kutzneria TaxID=43356 RepID=W5WF67_9PSEU|nr:4-hydroxyphenylpyruvate dioxygenase [Kutzneria albida]AHH99492.1 hypothetical protein KALB_6132 [Kutzneria albida DSM 43870]MBA8922951.1 4-hydroxymandelate synthase [Kutzneria viridogrisea]
MNDALRLVRLDHVEFFVTDLAASVEEMTTKYEFTTIARSPAGIADHRSVALRQGGITLVLTQGLSDDHPASGYVHAHGAGVANIALRTPDVRAALDAAAQAGARVLQAPSQVGGVLTAVIEAFGDVRHTFVQRPAGEPAGALPPGLLPVAGARPGNRIGLGEVDHFAVCVEAGQLVPTVEFYESVLGFRKTFEERIVIGAQAMDSQVVQNAQGDVTFTIIEPDTTRDPGQIDEFIKDNGGAGVQHLALSSADIVRAVGALRDNGIDFLTTPGSYYDLLPGRIDLAGHTVPELRELNILADADHAGQLYQIFTRSTHPRRTFFMEVIERLGAQTFGSGNIKALYEAVEQERLNGESRR